MGLGLFGLGQFIAQDNAVSREALVWLACPLIAAVFVVKWCLIKFQWLSRDDERSWQNSLAALLGLGWALLLDSDRGAPLLVAFVSAVNVFLYVYWSTTPSPGVDFGVRERAPLSDPQGKTFFGPQLLVVLRGPWDPYSSLAFREMADFVANGMPASITVTVISPQPFKTLLRRCREVVDKDLAWAEAQGLSLRGSVPWPLNHWLGDDSVLPGIVFIDRSGKVAYQEWASSLRTPLNLRDPSPRLLKLINAEFDGL